MASHHYMVDYEAADGSVQFANDDHIYDLAEAMALAKKQSKTGALSAYVVAFYPPPLSSPFYQAVGHIGFHEGEVSDVTGVFVRRGQHIIEKRA